ncbi:MAG: Glu-tRNA(Gln) amidotransferase subunit GatD [Candidatus Aenigmarchaeota archaeon]|nr:Glu-tRNA(Gln) amidotransferase subunit GatD [Candidatus Aenigmarchaeota archaeon]
MEYSVEILGLLKKCSVKIGDRAVVNSGKKEYKGIIMPNTGDSGCLVLKLDNGYNLGIELDSKAEIKKTKEEGAVMKKCKREKLQHDPSKPTIAILHTGGTIASRVDYRTGGVTPVFDAEDLVSMVPELADVANIRCRLIFQMWSEDMEPEHWQIIAKEIVKEIEEGCDGIIITHGTDYMHYTAAALAFMARNLPIPVILTGSQRSSDRGSSDAAMNLICAANFIANSDFSGIAICMHGSSSDAYCNILPACKTRKMHTSRRDAFKPINTKPIARVDYKTGRIEFCENSTFFSGKNYNEKDFKRIPVLEIGYNKKVALIKSYPGMAADQLDWYMNNCDGVVFEGGGIAGNLAINVLDDLTKHHALMLKKLKDMTSKGIVVYMTSQCIYGRVNMNVYTTGRDMQSVGCMPAYMIPEVALVKLGWVLGRFKNSAGNKEKIDELMQKNIAGEIISRSELDEFSDEI